MNRRSFLKALLATPVALALMPTFVSQAEPFNATVTVQLLPTDYWSLGYKMPWKDAVLDQHHAIRIES